MQPVTSQAPASRLCLCSLLMQTRAFRRDQERRACASSLLLFLPLTWECSELRDYGVEVEPNSFSISRPGRARVGPRSLSLRLACSWRPSLCLCPTEPILQSHSAGSCCWRALHSACACACAHACVLQVGVKRKTQSTAAFQLGWVHLCGQICFLIRRTGL